MRRWLLILLLFALPFQTVWAAATPYCAHESGTQGQRHFGHHEHQHQNQNQDGDQSASLDMGGLVHPDCESCHLGCSVLPPARLALQGAVAPLSLSRFLPPRYESPVPSGPERPDRDPLPSAARFAGSSVGAVLQSS